MKTFLLACLILGFASAENGQCAPHGASTPALRTAMDAALSANVKFEALREEHKKMSNKKLPPSVKKRKLGKLGKQVDDQYDVRQVHVTAVLEAYDVNDGSIDHRSIGINFDMLGMLSDCVRSFKAHIRHAARETADVRGSAYDDLGVSLLRTGNSMSGQNSRLVYSQAKWAFSKSTELRGSNAINQDNVNALAKSVQVQLKMDLAELEAVSIDKEINAGSTFFGDDDDDDDMPSALKGIFDDDDDDDDEEEEEEGGKGNSAMKGTFDDDDDEDDDDDGATPKNDEKEKNKADFWADDDEDED